MDDFERRRSEGEFVADERRCKGLMVRRYQAAWDELRCHEAWLWFEKWFENDPDIEAFSVDRNYHDDNGLFYTVWVRYQGEEDFRDSDDDDTGAVDDLQNKLNNWRDLEDVGYAISEATIARSTWLERATDFLGADWAIGRERYLLERGLSEVGTPAPTSKLPRL
jgi:hypothetical protein